MSAQTLREMLYLDREEAIRTTEHVREALRFGQLPESWRSRVIGLQEVEELLAKHWRAFKEGK